MPDKRTHRGPHPEDAKLFAANRICDLRAAIADFSLLLTKGYAEKSALKLVGDRLSLTEGRDWPLCAVPAPTSSSALEISVALQ